MKSTSYSVALKVHKFVKLTAISDMSQPFHEIVCEYSRVIVNDPAIRGTMKWRLKEILSQDPLIRVCIDHMIMVAGGITKWGGDPGYVVLQDMIYEGTREPCMVRTTRDKDDDPASEKQYKPGDDLYEDTPYDGGEHVTSENSWLFLNCDPDTMEGKPQKNSE